YRHRADERWRLGTPELAVLAVLLLRGPQSVDQVWDLLGDSGHIHSRTEVEAALDTLGGRTPRALARRLAPAAGARDVTWTAALRGGTRGDMPPPPPPAPGMATGAPSGTRGGNSTRQAPTMAEIADRLTNIERRLAGIETALLALRGGPQAQGQAQGQ